MLQKIDELQSLNLEMLEFLQECRRLIRDDFSESISLKIIEELITRAEQTKKP